MARRLPPLPGVALASTFATGETTSALWVLTPWDRVARLSKLGFRFGQEIGSTPITVAHRLAAP